MSAVQLKNRQRYFHETGYKNKLVSDNVQRTKTVTPPTIFVKFVVVALLFYVHGKHLRSCQDVFCEIMPL